jgi:hypothetical protein
MYTHPRSVAHKVFDAWISPDRFTKNPDIVRLPEGRLLLVYSDTDFHWSMEVQILTILASDDDGATWFKLAEVDRADLTKGDERLVTPRLNCLSDGRLAVIVDHDDYGHFHEDQSSGNWIYWSADGGKTWSDHQTTGIMGFEPDRIIELPDGSLAVGSHIMFAESQMYAEIMSCSDDHGKTWHRRSVIAHDGYHFFCEGALVILKEPEAAHGTRLACIMRENRSAGIPCFVCFSDDLGKTWTKPEMAPFALHRPYAKQLKDGRVMVTGRHVNGGLGTYAWIGDLQKEAGTYAVGGPRTSHAISVGKGEMAIVNGTGLESGFTLLPPEDNRSEFHLEFMLRLTADNDEHVAYVSTGKLAKMVFFFSRKGIAVKQGHTERLRAVDFSTSRKVEINHKNGLLAVSIDGEAVFHFPVIAEGPYIGDFHGGIKENRVQFGGCNESGRSFWRNIAYSIKNRTLPPFSWEWDAESGLRPDRYQQERMIQIHQNDTNQQPWPDHGYSSWLVLPDGRIILVDYTNRGDKPGKSHIVGVHLEMSDLK